MEDDGAESGEDLAVIMAAFKKDMVATFSGMLDQQSGAVKRHVDKAIGRTNVRIDGIEQAVGKQGARMDDMAREHRALAERLRAHEERVQNLENLAALPAPNAQQLHEEVKQALEQGPMAVDPRIIRVNSTNLVAKEAVEEAVAKLAARAEIKLDTYEVRGGDLGRRFTVSFNGEPRTAARRATKLNSMLRMPDGSWEQLAVETPNGDKEVLYISLDKSRATIRKEKLLKVLVQEIGMPEVRGFRREFAATWKWQVVATTVWDTETKDAKVVWNRAVAAQAGIDPTTIDKQIAEKLEERKRG